MRSKIALKFQPNMPYVIQVNGLSREEMDYDRLWVIKKKKNGGKHKMRREREKRWTYEEGTKAG